MVKKTLLKIWMKTHRVKVLHSIPGRLRLKIPGMDKVPDAYKKYEKELSAYFLLLPGISSVEYSYLTSKILLTYDVNASNESTILAWVEHIWNELMESALKHNQIPKQEEIEQQLSELHKRLENELQERH